MVELQLEVMAHPGKVVKKELAPAPEQKLQQEKALVQEYRLLV
jgi:hypothetical protein